MNPLAGKRILITRAQGQASLLRAKIEEQGGEALEFPVIATLDPLSWEPLDRAIACLLQYQWLVITSPNGAEKFIGRLVQLNRELTSLAHLKVVAVGAATAQALANFGVQTDVIPSQSRGKAIPTALGPLLQPGEAILLARADLADPGLKEHLILLGARVDDVVAYRTVLTGIDPGPLKRLLAAGQVDYVSFTSASTVTNLLLLLGGKEALAMARIACIGPETQKAAEAAGLTVHVLAREVSMEGLVAALVRDSCRVKEGGV